MSTKHKKIITKKNTTTLPVENKTLGGKNRVWLFLAGIGIATFIIYSNALSFGFLKAWDDQLYITQNHFIKALHWENIKSFFTEYFVGNYQPLSVLSYAIEYHFAGDEAFLFHFNNIILHIINTVLVFVFTRKISPKSNIAPLFTAAFFAVHPMHVESVVWISERKDVLYTFFFLLSLIFYVDYFLKRKNKFLLFSGVFFVFSCLSKSAAVVLPLILLLLDYYLNRKTDIKLYLEKVPFFAVSLVFGIVALRSQDGAIPDQMAPLPNRILIASESLISYLSKAIFPVNLSALYPYPQHWQQFLPWHYYIFVLTVVAMSFFVWHSRKWGKDIIFGFLFFIITIALVLQFVTVGLASMADRYTYVPYIGLFFMIGKLLELLFETATKNNHYGLSAILTLLFFIASITAQKRVNVWQNDELLFSNVISQYPECAMAYNCRGVYYLANTAYKHGSHNTPYFEKAYQDFNTAITLNPNLRDVYLNRGASAYFLNNFTHAINDLNTAEQLRPNNKLIYNIRGLAKMDLNDFSGALRDFDNAIKLDSSEAEFYFNKGNALRELGDYEGTLKAYDKNITLAPYLPEGYVNRGFLRYLLQDYAGAVSDFDNAIILGSSNPDVPKYRNSAQKLSDNPKTDTR